VLAKERFTIMTFNVWNTEWLDKREASMIGLLDNFATDIIMLQEVRPKILEIFDKAIGGTHKRVTEGKENGWTTEGNIYFNESMFSLVDFGAEDIGLKEKDRRLFWVRLQSKISGKNIWVGDSHFTWEGAEEEVRTGMSPRIGFSNQIAKILSRLHNDSTLSAVIFGGDLNDRFHPRHVLRKECGFIDTVSSLGLTMRSTWPTPSWRFNEDPYGGPTNPCDWIFVHPQRLKVLSSCLVDYAKIYDWQSEDEKTMVLNLGNDATGNSKGISLSIRKKREGCGIAVYPSDHFPVMAVLEFRSNQASTQ
jgi:exonuclease III